jgi:hypothetical protein
MLGMFDLRMLVESLKMTARVARKLFATIRYRFSHLDDSLIWKTGCGQVGRFERTSKLLKRLFLIMDSSLLRDLWVPVVVAD